MVVIYRLCPEGNPNKQRPIWPKIELIKACYASFKRAFDTKRVRVRFLVDKPTDELIGLLEGDIETFDELDWNTGNETTYFRALDIAAETDDKVFLLEDDYYFLDNAGDTIESALDELGVITPYDHPGYYTEDKHNYKRNVVLAGGHHWQTVKNTTLTFGVASGKIIRDNIDKFKSYSVWDEHIWENVGMDIYAPIPSLATHMESNFLSPNIKWQFQ